jgi:hypothetical protein
MAVTIAGVAKTGSLSQAWLRLGSGECQVCSPTAQVEAATAQVQRRKWKLLMSDSYVVLPELVDEKWAGKRVPNTRGSCNELNIWRHLLKLRDIFHLVEVCQSGWRISLKSDMVKGNFSSSPDTTSVELDGNDA